jgi:hypothetical protein
MTKKSVMWVPDSYFLGTETRIEFWFWDSKLSNLL